MIVSQTFRPSDLGVVLFLVLLEGLLSADNAIVMALLANRLPEALQRKALFYGLVGAFVFRLIAIVLASYILTFWWLQLLGAGYLLALPIKHFFFKTSSTGVVSSKSGFWKTVIAVEFTDIAFAIDSILAGVALVASLEKLWVVYLGAIIGLVLLRFAAIFFIKLLKIYHALDDVAYILVGWVGIKMLLLAGHNYVKDYNSSHTIPCTYNIPEMNLFVFWGVMFLIVLLGIFYVRWDTKKRA